MFQVKMSFTFLRRKVLEEVHAVNDKINIAKGLLKGSNFYLCNRNDLRISEQLLIDCKNYI